MNEILLSVIVPVYNVQEYLEKSLDSLIRQGSSSYELIFVNDGSTDSSYEILKRYEEKV
ncbi:MAG: glycosyltransferase, partial [Erysipelotrichaceae bacterium]|nr:glycosyltransferase [Erysipelotrichaceae bacterium]